MEILAKTRPDDSGRGKAGASRHVGELGSEEIPNLILRAAGECGAQISSK